MSGGLKRCLVVWAEAGRALQVAVDLEDDATVADVIEEARRRCGDESVPWQSATVGIFGEPCAREARPRDGDRIELYRALRTDPKAARRSRARPRASG